MVHSLLVIRLEISNGDPVKKESLLAILVLKKGTFKHMELFTELNISHVISELEDSHVISELEDKAEHVASHYQISSWSSILGNLSDDSYLEILRRKIFSVKNEGTKEYGIRERLCALSDAIDKNLFYRLILIPAAILILILSLRVKRRRLGQGCYHGKPGLIFAVNLLNRQKHRFSYVAAFTFTSWVMLDIILGQGDTSGLPFYPSEIMPHAKSFYLLVAGLQYAFIYYPVFVSITCAHLTGYILGTLYIWTLTAVFVIGECLCRKGTNVDNALEFAAIIPPSLCFLYLSISLPLRVLAALYSKMNRKKQKQKRMEDSAEKAHVRSLVRSRKGDIKVQQTRWYHRIYCPRAGFKYSISVLTGATMGTCFVYMAGIQILHKFFDILDYVEYRCRLAIKMEKTYDKLANKPIILLVAGFFNLDITYVNDIYVWILEYLQIVRGCVYASLAIATISVVCSLLLTLKSYKRDMLLIYRGYPSIPKPMGVSTSVLLLRCVRYVGYQTAYATWGFLLQFIVIFSSCTTIVTVIVLAILHDWQLVLISIIQHIWVALVVMVSLFLIQNILAIWVFTSKDERRRGILAIDNRRFFHNFHYFAVFANTAIGFISCPLRILKAIIFLIWSIPRLDMSPLGRQFEQFDPGYMSYICLLHLENAHGNPTMLVAAGIFMETLKRSPKKCLSTESVKRISMRQSTRNRWHLLWTLYHNPDLRMHRKTFVHPENPARAVRYLQRSDWNKDF